jgi:hypothetical protein
MAQKPSGDLDIPIISCPVCVKRRPLTIKTIVPRMRAGGGARVAYLCFGCGATEHRTVGAS